MDDPSHKDDDENSLEFKDETTEINSSEVKSDNKDDSGSLDSDNNAPTSPVPADGTKDEAPKKSHLPKSISRITKKVDVYVLGFILIILIAAVAIYVVTSSGKQKNNNANSQTLSQSTINQLNNNDVDVGGAQQTLDIQSNSVFSGNVIVKNNLQVAGTVSMGGALSAPSISVSGTSNLDQVNVNNLSDGGTASILGQLTVKAGIADDGSATFGGNVSAPSITVSTLQLNGDIQIAHHITTNGSIPSAHSDGAIGGGGTTTVSGTDTAGTVVVNTGSGASTGCFTTIDFASSYSSSPHVVITPVQTSGGSVPPNISFYVTRSSSSFSICSPANLPDGVSFGFDYIVID